MTVSDDLRILADAIAVLEEAGYVVDSVEPDCETLGDVTGTEAVIDLELPGIADCLDRDGIDLEAHEVTRTGDGGINLELALRLDRDDGADPEVTSTVVDPGDERVDGGVESDSGHVAASAGHSLATVSAPSVDADAGSSMSTVSIPPVDESETTDGDANSPEAITDDDSATTGDDQRDPGSDAVESDPEVPVHRDPDRLRAVYDPDATFAEMRDALEAEVRPQTVRKHMVKHGIHEPASHDTSSRPSSTDSADSGDSSGSSSDDSPEGADSSESPESSSSGSADGAEDTRDSSSNPQSEDESARDDGIPADDTDRGLVERLDGNSESSSNDEDEPDSAPEADRGLETDPGSGRVDGSPKADEASGGPIPDDGDDLEMRTIDAELPDHLTVEAVVEAVHDNRTMLAIARELDLDRTGTRELLEALDLVEVVHGRLAEDGPPRPSIEEIEDRIRKASLK